jgi:protein TonB
VTRRGRNRLLVRALGASAALHLLAAGSALEWPRLWRRPPPPVPDQEASVDVVMGASAETNGTAAAVPPPTPTPQQTDPAATPPPSAEAAESPAVQAAPPPAAPMRPEASAWQTSAIFGDGMVGAAEIVGERLRPAQGNRGNLPPGYPALSARLGEQGTVVLRMSIGADGFVTSVEVQQSSGYPRLDEAAQAALAKWRFAPAMKNGLPVESAQNLPVRFRLN